MDVATPPERIMTPRLELRRYERSFAENMFELVDAERERLGRFLPWVEKTKTLLDEQKYIEFAIQSWDEKNLFDFGLFLKGRYIGSIGVHTISWANERCEIGYWLGEKYSGQGLVKEAVIGLLERLFDLGFYRVEIRCDQKNTKSSQVAVRAGFRLEGVFLGDEISMGQRRNTLVFARCRNESVIKFENLTH